MDVEDQQRTSCIKPESRWKKEWGSLISFSHGTSNARGVAVLFRSKLDIVILQELFDSKGRLLVLNVKIKVDILASIKTDHSSIVLELQDIQETCRGPGFWKLNFSLLSRPDYVDMINNEFRVWLEETKDLSSTRSKWDWIKFNIRTSSIAYSKKLKKDHKKQEEELNSKY